MNLNLGQARYSLKVAPMTVDENHLGVHVCTTCVNWCLTKVVHRSCRSICTLLSISLDDWFICDFMCLNLVHRPHRLGTRAPWSRSSDFLANHAILTLVFACWSFYLLQCCYLRLHRHDQMSPVWYPFEINRTPDIVMKSNLCEQERASCWKYLVKIPCFCLLPNTDQGSGYNLDIVILLLHSFIISTACDWSFPHLNGIGYMMLWHIATFV